MQRKEDTSGVHVWLVLMKTFHALRAQAQESLNLSEPGLGDSDFRVLEVLLSKGPLPVNTIGPKVWLTPGSISVAVDRLEKKRLVKRQTTDDRRVRPLRSHSSRSQPPCDSTRDRPSRARS